MNNHYIPRLLLRRFAVGERVNTYDFETASFCTKKIKNTFVEKDLFDRELEKAFADKLEGPIGDLLNHKLFGTRKISIDREENLLLRKFLMINCLRSPYANIGWEDMVKKMHLEEHDYVKLREMLFKSVPYAKQMFDTVFSPQTYIPDLKMAMEREDIQNIAEDEACSLSLRIAARHAMLSTVAFWDSEHCGQEFILTKISGSSEMDYQGLFHKAITIRKLKAQKTYLPERVVKELDRLEWGSSLFSDNYSVYPLSPTRAMICFSPYFRAFFDTKDEPPLLGKEQFERHFYRPWRMELFEPCENYFNKHYHYHVKALTAEEVMRLNSLQLQMEPEEFVFHDYSKIRDSFWYYDRKMQFADTKKHSFEHIV